MERRYEGRARVEDGWIDYAGGCDGGREGGWTGRTDRITTTSKAGQTSGAIFALGECNGTRGYFLVSRVRNRRRGAK